MNEEQEKRLLTECPECESKKIHLVKNGNGTKEFYCPDCHYSFIPAYMMDENIQIVRRDIKIYGRSGNVWKIMS